MHEKRIISNFSYIITKIRDATRGYKNVSFYKTPISHCNGFKRCEILINKSLILLSLTEPPLI